MTYGSTDEGDSPGSPTRSPGSPTRWGSSKGDAHNQSILQVTIDADGDAIFEEVEPFVDEEAGGVKGCLQCDCDTNDLHYMLTLWVLIALTLAAFVHAFIMEVNDIAFDGKGLK